MITDYKILVDIDWGYKFHQYIIRKTETDKGRKYDLYDGNMKPIKIWSENDTLLNKDVFLFMERYSPPGKPKLDWKDKEEEEQIEVFCTLLINKIKKSNYEIEIDNYKYILISEYIIYL